MSENAIRKNQLRLKLDRNGTMLDEGYVARAKELYNQASAAMREAGKTPDVSLPEAENDIARAAKIRPSAHLAVKIAAASLLILGALSLLLPLNPFASRLPICGAFLGLGGIVLFSFLLGSDKRRSKAREYRDLLQKYGVETDEDIPVVLSEHRLRQKEANEACDKLMTFIRFADPAAKTAADCENTIRTVEAMLIEYRSL